MTEKDVLTELEADPASAHVWADWYEDQGMPQEARRLRERPHAWSDVSYHGSPLYRCDHCHTYERSDADPVCPQAVTGFVRSRKRVIELERSEHARLKAMFDRWAYLKPQGQVRRVIHSRLSRKESAP